MRGFSWPTIGPTPTQPSKQPWRTPWGRRRGRRPLASPAFPTPWRDNHLGPPGPWDSFSIATTRRRRLEPPLFRRSAGSGPAAAPKTRTAPSYPPRRADHAETLLGSCAPSPSCHAIQANWRCLRTTKAMRLENFRTSNSDCPCSTPVFVRLIVPPFLLSSNTLWSVLSLGRELQAGVC